MCLRIFATMRMQSSWLTFFCIQEMKSFLWFASHLLRWAITPRALCTSMGKWFTCPISWLISMVLQGPLAWALIVWRCSLVFSSVDKIVSVLIHLLPGELDLIFLGGLLYFVPLNFFFFFLEMVRDMYAIMPSPLWLELGSSISPMHLVHGEVPCGLMSPVKYL